MAAECTTATVWYLRVASGSRRKRESSLRIQRQAILHYARIHGAEIRHICDCDSACDHSMQDELRDALQALRGGLAKLLIVESLERLSGGIDRRLQLVLQTFTMDAGPALVCVRERIDSRSPGGRIALQRFDVMAAGKRVLGMRGVMTWLGDEAEGSAAVSTSGSARNSRQARVSASIRRGSSWQRTAPLRICSLSTSLPMKEFLRSGSTDPVYIVRCGCLGMVRRMHLSSSN